MDTNQAWQAYVRSSKNPFDFEPLMPKIKVTGAGTDWQILIKHSRIVWGKEDPIDF